MASNSNSNPIQLGCGHYLGSPIEGCYTCNVHKHIPIPDNISPITIADSGLGDMIEKALTKLGITRVVKEWLGEKCGCKERQEKLNKLGRLALRVLGIKK